MVVAAADPKSAAAAARRELDRRLHALVDTGDFLLGFTVENIDGEFQPRARLFDLHCLSWHPVSIPVRPSAARHDDDDDVIAESGRSPRMPYHDLPIDGRWEMRMDEYSTITCVYTSPSRARLLHLHVDRCPTDNYPISIFVRDSVDIRPVLPARRDAAFQCKVIHEPDTGRLTVVTDDYQEDRDSITLHDRLPCGKLQHFGCCNLAQTTDDLVVARSSTGDMLLITASDTKQAIQINRETGEERHIELTSEEDEEFPVFDWRCSFHSSSLFHSLDSVGDHWTLNVDGRKWRRREGRGNNRQARAGQPASLCPSPTGRLLHALVHAEQKEDGSAISSPHWIWLQPASLKMLSLDCLNEHSQAVTDVGSMYHPLAGRDATVAYARSMLEAE